MRNKINEKILYTTYKRSSKWLGIIDYKSLCVILIYIFIVINLLDIANIALEKSVYIFLFLTVPIISIIIVNVNNESAINVILSILTFMMHRGIYVDMKFIKMKNERYK
ncbi:MAG: hypothetical protein Q4D02_00610 [Clostridia bacterium]|nr:hypothetical protein [Clostridia bacterium]